jgi:hypothetical protein
MPFLRKIHLSKLQIDKNRKLGQLLILEDGTAKIEIQSQLYNFEIGTHEYIFHDIGVIQHSKRSYARFGKPRSKAVITPNIGGLLQTLCRLNTE